MDNKKLKIIALILAIIAIGLITYVVYDISNKSEEELNYGNKEPNNEINNSNENDTENEEDNQSQNDKYLTDEDYDFDYDLEKCKEKYKSYYIHDEIYKIKVTNPSGAKVYDSPWEKGWEKDQEIINTVEYGKELSVVGDTADGMKIDSYDNFDEIKEDYYFAIHVCGKGQYIKYSDVEIIDDSITNYKTYDKITKFYVYEDEYLYSGPGLSFEEKNDEYKVSKGTILSADKYITIGSAEWAYVNLNGKKRWLLEPPAQPVTYPYADFKYPNTAKIDDEKGELYLENEEKLYKYAFSGNEVILNIPKGTKVSYDYTTAEPGCIYYHVNYNNNSGWIAIIG